MKTKYIFIVILLVGLFLRLYRFDELFYYGHDHDLEGWFIRDILENHHLRLIGQETSQKGVFIGALWYYLLIPFYLLANMDPIGGILLSVFVSGLSLVSIYFVFTKVFSKDVAMIGSAIYALSFLIIFTDREVVPTTPLMLWSIWFLYTLYLIKQGKQKLGFILAAILIALIWHINLSLLLLTPLLLLSFILSRNKLNLKHFIKASFVAVLLNLPLIAFEIRHDFNQIQAVTGSIIGGENKVNFLAKLDRTMQLVYKNTTNLFYGSDAINIPLLTFWFLLIILGALAYKKFISYSWVVIFLFWQAIFILFFSLNSINLSEYYLNGMNIVWIAIASLAFVQIFKNKNYKWLAVIIGFVFVLANAYQISNIAINRSGYLQRKQVVEFIKQDSLAHNYPCVAVSYIVTPGNDLGYRYFYYLENLHVNQPKSGSPVYTIVFPHTMVDHLDKTFGALGLLLPDYGRYNQSQVDFSCSGKNANLTDPMFGMTQ